MKVYIKPVFECVELRVEERLAGSPCNTYSGACHDEYGNPTYFI